MNYTVIVAEDEELLLNNLVHKIEKADPDFGGTDEPGCGIYGYQDARHGRNHPAHQDP